MPTTMRLQSGEKAKVFSRSFSSIPINFKFQASAIDGGQPDGEIEIRGSNWVFPKPPLTQKLQAHNVVQAGVWDTFFTVFVIAHSDLEVTTARARSNLSRWIIWFAVAVGVFAVIISLLVIR